MNDMQTLRIVGIVFAVCALFFVWYFRFCRRRLRNFDALVGSFLALTLLLIAIFPNALNAFLEFFSFEKGGGGRILGLLVFSNFFVYLLIYVSLTRSRNVEQQVDRLVRELAKREFRKHQNANSAPIYVVIPAYNEAENVGDVLKRIPEKVCGLPTRTFVVIDGATDETEEVVTKLDHMAVTYTINRGGGSALKAGYQIAVEDGAEIVVTLDADGQHLPEEIPKLVKPILDGEADLVNGSRILGHYEKDNQLRAVGVVVFNWLISVLMMQRITDSSNAFRALRTSAYSKLDLRQTQFHSAELLIEALKKDLRVIEIPITIRPRLSGESKKGPSVKYAWGFTKAILGTWLR
jgi:hypothetical protein